MKTKTINVYTFEELKPEIQEKVIKEFQEEEDFYFLEDYLNEVLDEERTKHKISLRTPKEINLYYSLNYCQGDGVSFTGLFYWRGYYITITQGNLSNHYSHKYTTNINIETRHGNEAKEEVYKKFKKIYYSICDSIEGSGYSYIEDVLNEETIKNNIEENQFYFRENGELEHL